MAYVGTPIDTRNQFQSLQGKRFSGDGSTTAFTLDVAPSSTLDIEVFVGNVRQDPNSAYTLSGTTLTFTGAPPSGTNNIYVVHQAKAVGTITPPDSSITSDKLSGNLVTPGTFDVNGQELILDADADTSITADTDDQIDFKTGGTDRMHIVSGGNIGIGTSSPDSFVHIFKADGGALVDGDADELFLENSSNTGLTIGSGTSGEGRIHFSDSGDANIGIIAYEHTNNYMIFTAGTNEFARGNDNGILSTGGETSPEGSPGCINIDTNALDSSALSLKNSDVSHGFTSLAEADTYLRIGKADGSLGGVNIDAFKENGIVAIKMSGNADGTPDTTKSTSGNAIIEMHGTVRSGTSSAATSTANGNIFAVFNGPTCRFIFDAEGDLHSDSSNTTFDAYEDAHLVRAFDLSHGRGVIDSKFDKFVAYNHEKLADLKLVGKNEDGTPNHFINVTGMQRLHNGAIWQQYEKHNQLLEAVYDLAKEAVGEEKANAILEKHEVKRLQ